MACAHHIDDRLAVFQEMGLEPILLTSICVPRSDRFTHYRVPSLSPSGLRFELRQVFRRKGSDSLLWKLRNVLLLPLLPLYALERLFVRVDTVWYWFPLAYLRGKRICRHHSIDLLYSTGGPAVAHTVGRRLKKMTSSLKWLAEIQDPLIHSYCANTESELRLLHKVERETYRCADKMIFLTRKAMQNTEKRVQQTGKGVVVYPGAVPQPSRTVCDRDESCNTMVIGHFGSLGGVRNLAPLIGGLERAIAKHPSIMDLLVVKLYGNVGRDDQQRIAEFEQPNMFFLKGKVTRTVALNAMNQCDALLLIQGENPVSAETIPSKLYEYLHVGCPVLALVHENPEICSMLARLGHTCVSLNALEIAQAILKLYNQWKGGIPGGSLPSPYTVRKAVEQVLTL